MALDLLVPFAALALLRLAVEPRLPGVHHAFQVDRRGSWFIPEQVLLLGLLVLAITSRSGLLLVPVLAVSVGAAALFALDSGGHRVGSAREHFSTGPHESLNALHLGVAGAGGVLLLLWAVAAHLSTRHATRAAPA